MNRNANYNVSKPKQRDQLDFFAPIPRDFRAFEEILASCVSLSSTHCSPTISSQSTPSGVSRNNDVGLFSIYENHDFDKDEYQPNIDKKNCGAAEFDSGSKVEDFYCAAEKQAFQNATCPKARWVLLDLDRRDVLPRSPLSTSRWSAVQNPPVSNIQGQLLGMMGHNQSDVLPRSPLSMCRKSVLETSAVSNRQVQSLGMTGCNLTDGRLSGSTSPCSMIVCCGDPIQDETMEADGYLPNMDRIHDEWGVNYRGRDIEEYYEFPKTQTFQNALFDNRYGVIFDLDTQQHVLHHGGMQLTRKKWSQSLSKAKKVGPYIVKFAKKNRGEFLLRQCYASYTKQNGATDDIKANDFYKSANRLIQDGHLIRVRRGLYRIGRI